MASRNVKNTSDEAPQPTKKSSKAEAKAPVEPSNRDQGLTVVGIGASAGGLEALQTFFTALPGDTGLAFVVVTHLHPEYESHLAELLQRSTRMPTMQVTKRTKMEPNHVYVIPPNRSIQMTDTQLATAEFEEPRGRRTPIDLFFRSMAASGHPDPVAVILSGGGTDGSVGIKDVKEVGGLILVQQPEDAEYDSMPRAALTTGLVDVVLPAAGLAERLAEYVRHRPELPHDSGQLSEAEAETVQRILSHVHARTGHDFSQYKLATILRRIERRMQLNGFVTLGAYLTYLRSTSNEAQVLFNDILIGVTNFFRDQEAWTALEEQVIPGLFEQVDDLAENGIRVWSIGCATGEEAYGIAILLLEEAARREVRARIQIFASDLDDRSIMHAREGLYPEAIQADVSPERLERFFMREGEYYRVKREVRDVVLFTNHNVLRDPPFSRQHLIACRNVLIYLQRPVQDRIFDIFHYALNPGGYLFLGTSESADYLPDLFDVVDKNHRLYQAKSRAGQRRHVSSLPLTIRRSARQPDGHIAAAAHLQASRYGEEQLSSEEQHYKALEDYGPPSIIVNERYTIEHVSESAGRYLHQPKGTISNEILKIIRPELELELRTCLFHAFEKGKATVSRPVAVEVNGQRRLIVISVRPRPEEARVDRTEKQALVLFIEDESTDPNQVATTEEPQRTEAERESMVIQLQSEIQRRNEQLQITMEEYESSNEEMKAANEELQSINEEYRSATEELETSKEELQSVNEELQTVNNEMKSKIDELSQAHQELENLMAATEMGMLFLDRDMRIQRFTGGVSELFNVLTVDRGRRVSDLTHKMKYNNFLADAEEVLRNLTPMEREIERHDGAWFMMRLRPYRTTEKYVEGVVISFVDISALKASEDELVNAKVMLEEHVEERTRELAQANEQIRRGRDMFFTLFHSNPIPTSLTQVEDGRFINVNDAYLEFAGIQREQMLGHTAQEFGLPLSPAIRRQIIDRLNSEGMVDNLELSVRRGSGELATVLASVQLIDVDQSEALLLAFIDITDRVKAEQQIHSLAYDLTMAEQEERRRISQILHDDLQQRIFAVKMQVSALHDAYQQGNLQSTEVDFIQLWEWLDESISMTRNLSIDLSPAILKGEGLTDALSWLSTQMEEQYGLKVTLYSNGIAARYEDSLRILLFQAVREILFNIVKHANTHEATITMERANGHTQLTISDDGLGFDAESVLDSSKTAGGLLNLQHRLNLVGCKLQVKSQPNTKGTQVIIDIPLDK